MGEVFVIAGVVALDQAAVTFRISTRRRRGVCGAPRVCRVRERMTRRARLAACGCIRIPPGVTRCKNVFAQNFGRGLMPMRSRKYAMDQFLCTILEIASVASKLGAPSI